MKEDIISEKLRRELANVPIDTEPRVMYLLIEIRKVFEHDNIKGGLLGFYGDWVVHTKLYKKFANKVFEEINKENSLFIHQITSFNLIKDELLGFLKNYDLPTELIDKHWEQFRNKLLDILIDTPITNEKGDKSFGFYKKDGVGGIQYYLKEGDKFHTLGRVWI